MGRPLERLSFDTVYIFGYAPEHRRDEASACFLAWFVHAKTCFMIIAYKVAVVVIAVVVVDVAIADSDKLAYMYQSDFYSAL